VFETWITKTHPLLLEISTRCWLRSLSESSLRTITLTDMSESASDRWRGIGLTHLWLMKVWPTGQHSRAFCLNEPGTSPGIDGAFQGRELVPDLPAYAAKLLRFSTAV
jgi:hypothetical protein